ncbi:DUF1659 domain-containing protein [Acetobacterium fimetarium]|uniref:DUF1659 domain-containing protein n=1 Tax=Acetobacterium fimetarium TaxID=52691 RepID=A0ABR6WQR5_9FIRM|nr:DUF1659 domain-containing protein [Acetobacterium fimetarium]MBC3802969.1 DUF1659 domain-containing protein [Acetobacterium fimetarium]
MAITTDFLAKKIQIKLNHGMVDGKEKITSRSYGDVKSDATDQAIYDVAVLITGLQQPTLEEVIRQDLNLLLSA